MSKYLTITIPENLYERLCTSSEKMGLTKSAYLTYCMKQVFNQEDVLEKMPDVLDQMKMLSSQLKDMERK